MKIYLVISKIKDKVILNGVFSTPKDADEFIKNSPKVSPKYTKEELQNQKNFMEEYNEPNSNIKDTLKELTKENIPIQYKIIEYENYTKIILGGSIDE